MMHQMTGEVPTGQCDDASEQAGRDPSRIRRVFNVMGKISDTARRENGRRLVGPYSFWVEALHDYRDRLGDVFQPKAASRGVA
jgi:hypothetical protein